MIHLLMKQSDNGIPSFTGLAYAYGEQAERVARKRSRNWPEFYFTQEVVVDSCGDFDGNEDMEGDFSKVFLVSLTEGDKKLPACAFTEEDVATLLVEAKTAYGVVGFYSIDAVNVCSPKQDDEDFLILA